MTATRNGAHAASTASMEQPHPRGPGLGLSCRLFPTSMGSVELAGTVVDISRSGILIALGSEQVSGAPEPDAVVRVVVDLPQHPWFSPRCLECIGSVSEVLPLEAQVEVAVQIRQMRVTDQGTEGISSHDWLSAPSEEPIQ